MKIFTTIGKALDKGLNVVLTVSAETGKAFVVSVKKQLPEKKEVKTDGNSVSVH